MVQIDMDQVIVSNIMRPFKLFIPLFPQLYFIKDVRQLMACGLKHKKNERCKVQNMPVHQDKYTRRMPSCFHWFNTGNDPSGSEPPGLYQALTA